jgi:hypothetical protein
MYDHTLHDRFAVEEAIKKVSREVALIRLLRLAKKPSSGCEERPAPAQS